MTPELIDQIIAWYTAMLRRPKMYLGRIDSPEAVADYTGGFESALRILNKFPDSFQNEWLSHSYHRSHRWDSGYFTPIAQMRDKGLGETEIVEEIIKFEIDKWQKFREVLESKD